MITRYPAKTVMRITKSGERCDSVVQRRFLESEVRYGMSSVVKTNENVRP